MVPISAMFRCSAPVGSAAAAKSTARIAKPAVAKPDAFIQHTSKPKDVKSIILANIQDEPPGGSQKSGEPINATCELAAADKIIESPETLKARGAVKEARGTCHGKQCMATSPLFRFALRLLCSMLPRCRALPCSLSESHSKSHLRISDYRPCRREFGRKAEQARMIVAILHRYFGAQHLKQVVPMQSSIVEAIATVLGTLRCLACVWVAAMTLITPVFAQDKSAANMAGLNVVFPRDVEEQLALSAAPEHLRSDATVYVYAKRGYERLRSGKNGFTCLVNRDAFIYGAADFKPTCWDAQGATTYVPVMLKTGEMLAKGASLEAIKAAIDSGFAKKTFHAPDTGGVAYMLAGDVDLDPLTGHITRQEAPGHYMFYANKATNVQLGVSRDARNKDPTLPFVTGGGAGAEHGLTYMIAIPGEGHQHAHPANE